MVNTINTNREVTNEDIHKFFNGSNPQERIIKIECSYSDTQASVIYRDSKGVKRIQYDNFYPFCWAKQSAGRLMFDGDRRLLIKRMSQVGISVKGLRVTDSNGFTTERMEKGFRVLFQATQPMSYKEFLNFFEEAGTPLYSNRDKSKEQMFITASPVEQYMIQTGKRLFKGYDNYDDLVRMQFDLETEGLNAFEHAISQIGIKTNKGFNKIITIEGETKEEKQKNEIEAIISFLQTIRDVNPDVISGHNSENFDWDFINKRLIVNNLSLKKISSQILPKGVYKKGKESVLKLGGEVEYYNPTIMWGFNLTDSLFAVRRAQAIDSSMKKADLKYVTKYSKINKQNRVYVPGEEIESTWRDVEPNYAFNDNDGSWFKITDKHKENTERYVFISDKLVDNEKNISYDIVTGRYIVERYLIDDLWETDKVEERYNESNFLVGKMIPVTFERTCTMGTAAIWKSIMMAWSYEYGLAIPALVSSKKFTGGLSRLLYVGYVKNVVKLDYNSLYPSIILTYGIKSDIDIMGAMSAMLEYVLSQREFYKGEKAKSAKEFEQLKEMLINLIDGSQEYKITSQKMDVASSNKSRNDKLQLPLKITGNAFFGSYGADGYVFPWSDIICAEETTCSGRQCLRLMVYHFNSIGYTPLVGDSFTGDTPLFVRYKDSNMIDILPIEDMINKNKINIDGLNREYDYSEKLYEVLCRSGWCEPEYIYRHKTNKNMYEVVDGDVRVDITEDHSLYDSNKKELKPTDITDNTKLEYSDFDSLYKTYNNIDLSDGVDGWFDMKWLNSNIIWKETWFNSMKSADKTNWNKKQFAFYNFIEGCLSFIE